MSYAWWLFWRASRAWPILIWLSSGPARKPRERLLHAVIVEDPAGLVAGLPLGADVVGVAEAVASGQVCMASSP